MLQIIIIKNQRSSAQVCLTGKVHFVHVIWGYSPHYVAHGNFSVPCFSMMRNAIGAVVILGEVLTIYYRLKYAPSVILRHTGSGSNLKLIRMALILR